MQDRLKRAGSLKSRGNSLYQARKFDQAVEMYSEAIRVSPKPEPVFHSNRAACASSTRSGPSVLILLCRLHEHVAAAIRACRRGL